MAEPKGSRPAARVEAGWYVTPEGDRIPSHVRSLTHFRFSDPSLEAAFLASSSQLTRWVTTLSLVLVPLLLALLVAKQRFLQPQLPASRSTPTTALYAMPLLALACCLQDKLIGAVAAVSFTLAAAELVPATPFWAVLLASVAFHTAICRLSSLLWFDRCALCMLWTTAATAIGCSGAWTWPYSLLFVAACSVCIVLQGFTALARELDARMRFYIHRALENHAGAPPLLRLPFLTHAGKPGCMPDRDAELLPELAGIDFQPVFISGLHRSGTTLLYKTLSDVLPVAYLRWFDIVNYARLLRTYHDGTMAEEMAAADAYWAAVGLKTRLIDKVAASHAAAEEHGFIFMAHTPKGTNYLCAATAKLFSEMCAKLIVVQECHSGVVLIKNPWDHGHEAEIAQLYPNAKFIHIQRDLPACISSFLNILDTLMPMVGGLDPWIHSLLSRSPSIWAVFMLLAVTIGHKRSMRLIAQNLVTTTLAVKANAARDLAQLRAAQPHRLHELTYEQLMADPQGVVRGIAQFLDLEPDAAELARVAARMAPRQLKTHPLILEAVAAHERTQGNAGNVVRSSGLSAWTALQTALPSWSLRPRREASRKDD